MSYFLTRDYAMAKCKTIDEKIMLECIFGACENMIEEKVKTLIEKYMNEYKEKLIVDIETKLNGKMIDSINIVRAIQDEIANQLNI